MASKKLMKTGKRFMWFPAKDAGECLVCHRQFKKGTHIVKVTGGVRHRRNCAVPSKTTIRDRLAADLAAGRITNSRYAQELASAADKRQ